MDDIVRWIEPGSDLNRHIGERRIS